MEMGPGRARRCRTRQAGLAGAVCAAALLGSTPEPAAARGSPASRQDGPARLWIAGDVHLGEARDNPLAPLTPLLEAAPLVVNLEGPIVEPARQRGLLINVPASAAALHRAGVRVAGIANNHAGDAGQSRGRMTAAALKKAGILPAGLDSGPALLEIGGLRLAVTAHDLSSGAPEGLRAELRSAHGTADALIATFHVTGPPLYLPRPELREATRVALEEGASVVAAHGTHVIGPVERRGGAVIAWGLGNLAFECDCTEEREGLMLGVRMRGAMVVEAQLLPIRAGLRGGPAEVAPDPEPMFVLLEALGSPPLRREGRRAFLF